MTTLVQGEPMPSKRIRPTPTPDLDPSGRKLTAKQPRAWLIKPALLLLLAVGLYTAFTRWQGGRDRSTAVTPYRNARTGVRYVGDAACTRCHEEIASSYHNHPMGRSLSTIDAWTPDIRGGNEPRKLFEAQGFQYSIERRDGRSIHSETRVDNQGREVGRVEGDVRYVLGSGTRGASFLVDHDGYLFESPATWYGQQQRWDLSPGYAEKNAHFERPITAACLSCHANQIDHVKGTDNRYSPPTFRGHAIGCERCHGAGELHVKQPLPSPLDGPNIVNPRHLEPSLRESVCQQCHLIGVKNVERRGFELSDYRPGLPLHRFESVFVRPPGLAKDNRNSGHVEQMHESRCFRASRGELGCISCHDPHKLPPPQEKVSYYRDRCLACHADKGCTLEPASRRSVSAEDSCIACHMPRVSTTDIPHLATTRHDIPRHREAHDEPSPDERTSRPDGTPLVLFHRNLMSPEEQAATNRDLGLVLCLMGKKGAFEALPLLEAALAAHPDDVEAWEAKGYSCATLGRAEVGLAAFEKALGLAPRRESTLVGAGFFADRLGRGDQAISYFQRAIAVDPWRSDYHAAAALPLLEAGRVKEATEACRRALHLNPANSQARVVLIRCAYKAGSIPQARAEFEILLKFDPPDREGLIRWFNSLK